MFPAFSFASVSASVPVSSSVHSVSSKSLPVAPVSSSVVARVSVTNNRSTPLQSLEEEERKKERKSGLCGQANLNAVLVVLLMGIPLAYVARLPHNKNLS